MIRRGSLSGIAIVLLAAACAGCASARSTSNPGISSTAPASPSQRTVSTPVGTSPTTETSTAPRTYTFLGMTIGLQAGWRPGAVVGADGTTLNGIVTGGSCNSSNFGTDCPGFMELYDPGYRMGYAFEYGGGQSGCPQNRGLMQVLPAHNKPTTTTVSVGGHAAFLTQTRVLCMSADPGGGSTTQYTQRQWWIPSAQILVVDDGWMVSGLAGVLAHAVWAAKPPITSVMADYAGSWHRHTDEFVINPAGYGTEVDGNGTCPNDPTAMCGFVAVLSFTPTTDGLLGMYTSVVPTVDGVISLTFPLDPSEPHRNDSFVLKAASHHRLQFTQVGRLTQFNGPDRMWLCGNHTPPRFNTCGA